jgi:hypothetical protein
MATIFLAGQSFSQSATESDILALSNLKFHYMTTGKLDSLADLFDDKMLLQHANGMVQSKAQYLDNLKSGMLKYNKVDIKEAKATVVGSTAFVLGKCTFSVTFQGQDKTFDFGYTEVYALENDKWKMALYAVQTLQQ